MTYDISESLKAGPLPAAASVFDYNAIDNVAALRISLWDAGFRPVAIYNWDSTYMEYPGKAPKGLAWGDKARQNPPHVVTVPADPNALNTGMLCDGLRAIDIDIDEPTRAHTVRSAALLRFGDAPTRTRPNSSRCLLLYRAADGAPGKRVIAGTFGKVEVLGAGQQFVAFGRHETGAELSWTEVPGEICVDSLPAVTEADVSAFFGEVAPTIGSDGERKQADHGSGSASRHGLRGNIFEVGGTFMAILRHVTGSFTCASWSSSRLACRPP